MSRVFAQRLPILLVTALFISSGSAWLASAAAEQSPQQPSTPPVASAPSAAPAAPSPSAANGGRCFEMRTYYAAPGKIEALHARFRDHTTRLFAKHGMTNVGYWIPKEKPDTIVYVLAHKDRQAADEAWKAFRSDPDWQAARKASEVNGPLTTKVESVFMDATDYSPMK